MKRPVLSLIVLLTITSLMAQTFQNPILPGFYPDPSVCRVGNDYYMVNSSFQFFPGVPLHHSKDLVHWECIGHVLDRPSQINLDKAGYWNGIYAPTIRYHEGVFYMITTNVSDKGNFYVTTTNPLQGWSEPIWVNQGGIDPEIFFDEDGKAYFLSNGDYIQIAEIDLKTGHLLTESRNIWGGTGGRYPEAPHIYKKDGYYYLVLAEGGTEFGHKVTIARSRNLMGPYEPNPANPILTHQKRWSETNPIQGVGHADFIQAHDSTWWMVCLGFRPGTNGHHVLGRETFLAPVTREKNGWPVINGDGTIDINMYCPTLPQHPVTTAPARDEFNNNTLGYAWNWLSNPHMENYSLTERKGHLRLKASTITLDSIASPTMVTRRQQHFDFQATTCVDVSTLAPLSEAGLTIYMSNNYRYTLTIAREKDHNTISLNYHLGMMNHLEKQVDVKQDKIYLRIVGGPYNYNFYYSTNNKEYHFMGTMDIKFLSSETAGGFTGLVLGLFAQSTQPNGGYADFDWFEYLPLEPNKP